MYKWQQIKELKAKGLSIKEIVRQLKISKNTVRKYLRSPEPPRFKKRQYLKEVSKYDLQIKEMIEDNYIGTRIYEELLALGYEGSLSSVHRYIAAIREKEDIKGKVTTRFETAPGMQMQYDWKEWILTVNEKKIKVYIHQVILGYSRKKYCTYSLSITTLDVIRAIEEAIDFFDGLAPELVIDNPKQMVIVHENNGIIRYNDEFLKFCGIYGIKPNPCKNYRARTKGKVERPFYYIQEHLLRGLEVKELSEFDNKLRDFIDGYNNREHSTLKERPQERYLREKDLLTRIPKVEPTLLYKKEIRTVSNDGYISYKGSFYPMPMKLSLKDVNIESIFGRVIRAYDNCELVGEFKVDPFDKGIKRLHPEHKKINREYKEKKEARESEVLKSFLATFDSVAIVYVEGLKNRVGANLYWHLSKIMEYTTIYTKEVVSEVIKECTEIGAYHKNSIKRLLVSRKLQEPVIEPILDPVASNNINIRRDLSDYKVGGLK